MASGGYRPPTNPASVSGPGSLSQRTDGKQPQMALPNAGYGENAAFQQQEAAAPMASSQPPSAAPGGPPAGPGQAQGPVGHPPMPLTSGTLLPDQAVTHGADSGPGPGSASLNLANPIQTQHASALSMVQALASSPSASSGLQFLASALAQKA